MPTPHHPHELQVRAIYEALNQEFSPLELCSRLAPLIAKLPELGTTMSAASPVKEVSLAMYTNSLKQVRWWASLNHETARLKQLKQLSQVKIGVHTGHRDGMLQI